jgi:hypothetical protein
MTKAQTTTSTTTPTPQTVLAQRHADVLVNRYLRELAALSSRPGR